MSVVLDGYQANADVVLPFRMPQREIDEIARQGGAILKRKTWINRLSSFPGWQNCLTQTSDTSEQVLAYTTEPPLEVDCIRLQDGPLIEHCSDSNTASVVHDWAPWNEGQAAETWHMDVNGSPRVVNPQTGAGVRADKVRTASDTQESSSSREMHS